MNKGTRSLLQELEEISKNNRDINYIVESRGVNVISSAINLLNLIEKNFTDDQYKIFERKLLNAIKTRDQTKFTKSIRKK
jgi:hypothetical protein